MQTIIEQMVAAMDAIKADINKTKQVSLKPILSKFKKSA